MTRQISQKSTRRMKFLSLSFLLFLETTAAFVPQQQGNKVAKNQWNDQQVEQPNPTTYSKSNNNKLQISLSTPVSFVNPATYWEQINNAAQLGNPGQAKVLFDEMYIAYKNTQDRALRPNYKILNMILNAWAKSGLDNAPRQSEETLLKMWELSKSDAKMKPNVKSYTTVIDCWARSRDKLGAARALALLREMQALYENGETACRPNVRTYGTVLNAFARRGNANEAEALLEEMIKDYSNGNESAKPNTFAYTTVLNAWAKSYSSKAPERSEAILTKMRKAAETRPNIISYSSVVDCWTRSSDPRAAERAEALLREMQEMYQQGDAECRPNDRPYNAILRAYAQRGNGERAEALLEEMYHDSTKGGNHLVKPSLISFNAALNAWSKSTSPNAPKFSEAILKRMWDLHKKNNKSNKRWNCRPDIVSYNTVLSTWAKSNEADAPERAEKFLRQMQQVTKQGEKGLSPNTISYNAVIDSYVRRGNAVKAQAILEELIREKNGYAKPTTRSFNAVLNAWSKSNSELTVDDAPQHAEALLKKMKQLSQAGYDTRPDAISYTSVITCYSRSRLADAADHAERLMAEMKASNIKPDILSYCSVMTAWSRDRRREDDGEQKAYSRAMALLDELLVLSAKGDKTLAPSSFVFAPVLSMIASSSQIRRSEKVERMEHVLEMMDKNGVVPDTYIQRLVGEVGITLN